MSSGIRTVLSLVLTLIAAQSALCRTDADDSILNGFSWECANNASCVNGVAMSVIGRFEKREPLNFGLFSLQPVKSSVVQGRSNKFVEFLSGNAIRVPLGPIVFSVQQSEKDSRYLEVALLKSVAEGRGRKKISHKDKKQLQVMIPMFLAANAIGWTMLAVKAVGALTVKALLVSKLALLVAAGIILKKLMEKAGEKMMMPPYMDHHHHEHPYMMPYNMEYGLASHPIAAAAPELTHIPTHDDLYSLHMANPHDVGGAGMGQMVAESALSHAIENPNATVIQQQPVALAGGAYKVKRDDTDWTGITRRPLVYRYVVPQNPVHVYRQT